MMIFGSKILPTSETNFVKMQWIREIALATDSSTASHDSRIRRNEFESSSHSIMYIKKFTHKFTHKFTLCSFFKNMDDSWPLFLYFRLFKTVFNAADSK